MILRRKRCLRQSTKTKDSGQAEWASGIFFILILGIMMYTQLQLASWRSVSAYLEDALAASNLASALIDMEEYGKSHKVIIPDAQKAYNIYLDAVKDNLGLNQQWECANQGMFEGPVEIVDYVIYNVDGKNVNAFRVGRDGKVSGQWSGDLHSVKAPNGIPVECTGVYSEIQFPVQGFLGIEVQAHKGKLVDIVAEVNEKEDKSL